MSTIYTYFDVEARAWRNRVAGRDPFVAAHPDPETAVRAGKSLAQLFGAEHYVTSKAGRDHHLPVEDGDTVTD